MVPPDRRRTAVRSLAVLTVCVLAQGAAAPVAAEFYRWRDASGTERFAQELHRVPAEHRAEAEANREASADADRRGAIGYPAPPPRRRLAAEARDAAPPAARAPGAADCRALQKEIARKQKVIRIHESSVVANQRWADDITRSPFSRRKYEVRAEEEARWLDRARDDLEGFVDAQRRKGVEPGCLR